MLPDLIYAGCLCCCCPLIIRIQEVRTQLVAKLADWWLKLFFVAPTALCNKIWLGLDLLGSLQVQEKKTECWRPVSRVCQSSMAMDESLLPSNEEVEAFNDKVDEVTGLIAGLQARAATYLQICCCLKSHFTQRSHH